MMGNNLKCRWKTAPVTWKTRFLPRFLHGTDGPFRGASEPRDSPGEPGKGTWDPGMRTDGPGEGTADPREATDKLPKGGGGRAEADSAHSDSGSAGFESADHRLEARATPEGHINPPADQERRSIN